MWPAPRVMVPAVVSTAAAPAVNVFFATVSGATATATSLLPVRTVPSVLAVVVARPSWVRTVELFRASTLTGTAVPLVVSVQMVRVLAASKMS